MPLKQKEELAESLTNNQHETSGVLGGSLKKLHIPPDINSKMFSLNNRIKKSNVTQGFNEPLILDTRP